MSDAPATGDRMTGRAAGDPAFTILLPVHRPPAALPFALASVLDQTRQDFELFVICDGAPPETAACARQIAGDDPRVQVFDHPKGERNGEVYRDQALQHARGRFVCQIADDDLWFPNHLEEMAILLGEVEFGNLPQINVGADGSMQCICGDLARANVRRGMLSRRSNFFGPTEAGYHLAAYRRLPVGWSPAPPDIWSDLYMWRKFLAHPDITCGTRFAFTSLHVEAKPRRSLTNQQRAEENRRLLEQVRDRTRRDAIVQGVMRRLMLRAMITDWTVQHLASAEELGALTGQMHQDDEVLMAEIARLGGVIAARNRKKSAAPGGPVRRLLRWIGVKRDR